MHTVPRLHNDAHAAQLGSLMETQLARLRLGTTMEEVKRLLAVMSRAQAQAHARPRRSFLS